MQTIDMACITATLIHSTITRVASDN